MISNPARVVKPQLKCISMETSTYVPLKDVSIGGIVMLRHTKPGEDEDLVEPVAAFGPKPEEDREPEPPQPFEYTDD